MFSTVNTKMKYYYSTVMQIITLPFEFIFTFSDNFAAFPTIFLNSSLLKNYTSYLEK